MPMRASLILVHAAAFENNLLSLRGGGWTVRHPEAEPCAIVILAMAPRDQAGPHPIVLELLYADGEPVMFPTPDGAVPLVIENTLEVPPGLDDPTLTTPLDAGTIINLPPFPLPEGREYVWRLTIDGETRPDWEAAFRTTPPVPPSLMQE